MELKDKIVAVVGLGKSGMSSARLLLAKGARVTALEQRPRLEVQAAADELERLGAGVRCGGYGPADFAQAQMVVLSPGVDEREKIYRDLSAKGVEVIGDLELAARFIRAPIIAVTGTDGKTTTVSLLGEIFSRATRGKAWVGGNIGNPAAELALSRGRPEVVILEVSSFQLAQAQTFHPRVGVLLNLAADHFDRHPDLEAYFRAKARMFMNQDRKDAAVLNYEDPMVREIADSVKSRVIWFGGKIAKKHGARLKGRELVYRNARKEFKLSLKQWKPRGRHNLENLMAAAAAAGWFGAAPESIQDAVDNFQLPGHRIEFAAEVGGVRYYDDSKATTPHAVAAALNSFQEPVVLLLGGRNKGIDFRPLAPEIAARAKSVLCFGEARHEIAEQLAAENIKARVAEKMADAVMLAAGIAAPGEVVLLSPGCASFDEFKDYQDRGDKFKELVRKLK